jgi:hypothetical protein
VPLVESTVSEIGYQLFGWLRLDRLETVTFSRRLSEFCRWFNQKMYNFATESTPVFMLSTSTPVLDPSSENPAVPLCWDFWIFQRPANHVV